MLEVINHDRLFRSTDLNIAFRNEQTEFRRTEGNFLSLLQGPRGEEPIQNFVELDILLFFHSSQRIFKLNNRKRGV